MSKTNSQSTQAEECGVSKISAADWYLKHSNCSLAKLSPEDEALLDSLPLRTRVAIASEFDELAEKHLEVLSVWAAQQHIIAEFFYDLAATTKAIQGANN